MELKSAVSYFTCMLKFYRNTTNSFTRWVEEKLKEMVVAHKLINVDDAHPLPNDIHRNLPVLSDGHVQWTSENEIKNFLEKLHQDLLLSQSLQSDTCHIDPDNHKECL